MAHTRVGGRAGTIIQFSSGFSIMPTVIFVKKKKNLYRRKLVLILVNPFHGFVSYLIAGGHGTGVVEFYNRTFCSAISNPEQKDNRSGLAVTMPYALCHSTHFRPVLHSSKFHWHFFGKFRIQLTVH